MSRNLAAEKKSVAGPAAEGARTEAPATHGSGLSATLGAATVVAGASVLSTRVQATSPRLLVFLHAAVKQRALQSELQAPLPGLSVTAVGRISDFDRALQEGQDAVLTLPPVLKARGLSPKLQGYRGGKADEPYSLVSVGAAQEVARVTSVGALDILGREGTTAFVQGLLGAAPNVERVTKVEDLLALLQMQRVGAILLATRLVSELRATSRLALAETPLATRVELPALGVLGQAGGQALTVFAQLGQKLAPVIGVDEWR